MASENQEKAILQRVGKGGFWHSTPLDYSKETQDHLSNLMREAKLTLAQQREMKNLLKDDQQSTTSVRKKQFKGKNPYVGTCTESPPMCKGHFGLRSKETILKSGCYEVPKKPSVAHLEKPVREKEKLQNLMAFGIDRVATKPVETEKKDPHFPTTKERFEEVVTEIEERRQFLDDMRSLGVVDQYSTIINNQVAEKLRELELLNVEANSKASLSKQPD